MKNRNTRNQLPLLVVGTVKLPDNVQFSNAQATVSLEDVSFADAESEKIVAQIISNVTNEEEISFELRAAIPQTKGRSYAVSVHIKRDTDPNRAEFEQFEKGDFINTQSYPVKLSADQTFELVIEVEEV